MLRRSLYAASALIVFALSYYVAAVLWFPSAHARLTFWAKSISTPNLQHFPSPRALRLGTVAIIPELQPLGSAPKALPSGPIIITIFDPECPVARQSIPFWNQVARALSARGFPYIVAGCGANAETVIKFTEGMNLQALTYYGGPCDVFRRTLGMGSDIVHYALDARRVVLDTWDGMPIYGYVERDWIAQMINRLSAKEQQN